jgi:hypothetical protein
MEHASYFLLALLWIMGWGTIGAVVTPRIYGRKDLDVSQAGLAGAATGAAGGPFFLIPLWYLTPKMDWKWVVIPGLVIVVIFAAAFAAADPDNLCVTRGGFVATQLVNGLVIGIIYGLMALGLTLIFSILGVVSFAHGEFYMIGGGGCPVDVCNWHHLRTALFASYEHRSGGTPGRIRHPGHLWPGLFLAVPDPGFGRRQPQKGGPLH